MKKLLLALTLALAGGHCYGAEGTLQVYAWCSSGRSMQKTTLLLYEYKGEALFQDSHTKLLQTLKVPKNRGRNTLSFDLKENVGGNSDCSNPVTRKDCLDSLKLPKNITADIIRENLVSGPSDRK